MSGFHMVNDISLMAYSLLVIAACALYTTLRTAGVWRWIGAKVADALAWWAMPTPIAVKDMSAEDRERAEQIIGGLLPSDASSPRRPRRKRRPQS